MPKYYPPQQNKLYAVLTGDIIASTDLPRTQMEKTRNTLLESAYSFCEAKQCPLVGEPEFFRGDSWQLLMAEPSFALALALYLRATLRSTTSSDTRISIGIGSVHDINAHRTTLSNGEAFILSGRALDEMTGYFDLTGAVPERMGELTRWFPVTLHLCSDLVRAWTRRQSELVAAALILDNPTHEGIGKYLRPKVVKQSVTDILRSANWRAIQEPLRAFEETSWASLTEET